MKFSPTTRRRLRWFNLPTATLITLLQRTPVLPVLTAVEESIFSSPVVAVLKSAAALAGLGAMHSLAGATVLSASQSGTINAKVGAAITPVAFTVTNTINIASWQVGGKIPAGMMIAAEEGGTSLTDPGLLDATSAGSLDSYGDPSGGNSTTTPILQGTPTTAGTYTFTLQAFEFAGATGLTSSAFSVTVSVAPADTGPTTSAPTFTTQPSSQTVTAGGSVTFTAAAGGSPTPTFQWAKNGTAISGATNASLTLSNVSSSDAATYTIVATNSAGAATSTSAVLTVNAAAPGGPAPAITVQPLSVTVNGGGTVAFTVTATSAATPTYQWTKNGTNISGATSDTLILTGVGAADAASYKVVVTNGGGSTTSNAGTLAVTSGQISRISNLSVRTNLASGQGLTVGFVTSGTKSMLIRADGPALGTVFGLGGFFADPQFSLVSGGVTIGSDDDWPSNLAPVFASLGAFGFVPGSKDAAMLTPINGPTTAQVGGTGSGVMLVEVYDADPATAAARLTNVSARNQVGTGVNVLVSGFVVDGGAARTLLIRGIGPALHDVFGVNGNLQDPTLEIHETINGVDTVVASNDNWNAGLTPFFDQVGAYHFNAGSKDAALLVTLPPGVYTAQVAGVSSGTGDGVVEVYVVP
jgi:hypothetical protein